MTDVAIEARVESEDATSGIDVHEDVEFASYVSNRRIALREALEQYDLVGANHDPVNGSYIILADRGARTDVASTGFVEMGYSSPSPWTSWTREEWNPKLRDKLGLREYYKMKRQDGIVRGALRLLKTPIQAGRWFVEPASQSTRDINIAKFVERNLFEQLNVTWSNLLNDILLMCEYGHMVLEKVYRMSDDGKIVLQKLAPRHPLDIQSWVYDAEGGPDGIVMEPLTPAVGLGTEGPLFIPIGKLAVFSLEPEAGDLSGISVLRSAYKHYYYKDTLYKIDAIQKERHGIGVPVIKLPPGFSEADKRVADELGRNLRTNERAHVVLPPNWEIMFAVLEGQPVDCIKSIEHHNKMIEANILAPFMQDPSVDPKSTDMFLKSTRYIGLTITDIFNRYIIPQLVDINFVLGPTRRYPRLAVRRVGEQEDLRTMSFTVRNLVGAGIIMPDDPLEDFYRRELDLPPRDPETSRDVLAQQMGGDPNQVGGADPSQAGLPRQAPTPQNSPGKKSSGRDSSGKANPR